MKLPARALGIEFAEGRIHFVQMRRMFGPPSVTKMATLELSSAPGEAKVAERMSAFVSEKGLRSRRVVVGIPLKDAMIRIIELPSVEEKHLRQMLEFEIERSFPISAAEAYFDFALLERVDDRARLLVVAVERSILDRYKNLIGEAGLPTMAITAAILAEIELPALRETESEISALIRSNTASTEVAVLSRKIPAGIYRFTHPNGAGSTGNSTSPERLVSRLSGATRQACTSATGVPRPTRLVTSGRALSAEAGDELAHDLGIEEVEVLGRDLELENDKLPLVTAAALASWGVTSEGELPNLLPIDQRSGDTGTGTLAIGVQFGLAALLAIGLISGDLVGERRQLAALRAQLTELQPEVQLIKGLERDLVEQGKLSRSFASAGEQTINPLEVVREITRLLDHGAWISVLTLDGPKLTITGRAEKNDDVQQLKILLGGNDMFNEVSECSQTRVSDGVWKFKICANVVADALEAGR